MYVQRNPTAQFQSTHPVRGATLRLASLVSIMLFQSTHPVRGATQRVQYFWVTNQFQSTHPVRGATHPRAAGEGGPHISIHAPREGCDE